MDGMKAGMAFVEEGAFEQADDGAHVEANRFNVGTGKVEELMIRHCCSFPGNRME
jgi:hypothetical protein